MTQIKLKPEDYKTSPFDIVNYLHDSEDVTEYLKVSFETGDEKQITRALANAARYYGMQKTANKAAVSRQNLYKTLVHNEGAPTLTTLNKLIRSFGCYLSVVPAKSKRKLVNDQQLAVA
jgi:probable addiction module antidote protein